MISVLLLVGVEFYTNSPKGHFLGIAGGLSHTKTFQKLSDRNKERRRGRTDGQIGRQAETSLLAVETARLCKHGLPAWGLSGRRHKIENKKQIKVSSVPA